MSLNSVHWDIDILATSSIVHREDYTATGADTFALFRREKVLSPDGQLTQVPIISGSSFRGALRRIGESLTAEALGYEDVELPVPAAHLLSNGGRLAKSASPLTDEDERRLKALLPQIAVFGGAGSGRIMSGLLAVGKVLPEVVELEHILPRPPRATPLPAVRTLAEEGFSHLDDHRRCGGGAPGPDSSDKTSPLGRFGVETLPAGTRLQTWVRITNATDLQVAFLSEILAVFATRGHLGGRIAAGHGSIAATVIPTVQRGGLPDVDWAVEVRHRRQGAIAALLAIT
jgi:hypothetical protein